MILPVLGQMEHKVSSDADLEYRYDFNMIHFHAGEDLD